MRLPCPHCGERDSREFSYRGAALARPAGEGWDAAWDDYLHNRANPAGETRDLWHHAPCGTWVVVTRNTVTHAVLAAWPASEGLA